MNTQRVVGESPLYGEEKLGGGGGLVGILEEEETSQPTPTIEPGYTLSTKYLLEYLSIRPCQSATVYQDTGAKI